MLINQLNKVADGKEEGLLVFGLNNTLGNLFGCNARQFDCSTAVLQGV